ncbi:MAG TPA: alpha/beta hydrolase [Polyangiaceae bacterium]|nr:alpha/beta hydrolase [Polyangiaceae bacterium]
MSTPSDPVRLHVEVTGAGGRVVFAHGFGGSARNFRPQAKALASTQQVVLYDARGHARSEAPADPAAYAFERLVDDYERVAASGADQTGGPDRVVAGGLSLGAATALGFALRHPERVRGLVLASPPGGGDDPERRSWALSFAQAIEEVGLEAAGARFVWGERARFDPRGAALIRQGLMEHSPPALAQILRHALADLTGPSSLGPALRGLGCPALIVIGSEDASSAEPARVLASSLPDAELVVVPGAGHVVNLAAPDAFNAACRRLLERADRRGAP